MLGVSPSAWWLVAHKGFVAGKADVEICDVDGDIGRCQVRTAVELFHYIFKTLGFFHLLTGPEDGVQLIGN